MGRIHRDTLKDSVVQEIRMGIIRGLFPPGARLRLESLAEQYGVSVMPVREALVVLASEGMVTLQPRKGAFVTRFGPGEILEVYEIRAVLERLATVKAVPKMDGRVLKALESLAERMEVVSENPLRFVELNHRFHLTLYKASGADHLLEVIRSLRYRTQHYLFRYMVSMNRFARARDEHLLLVEVIKRGNAQEAGERMFEHVYSVGVALSKMLESQEPEAHDVGQGLPTNAAAKPPGGRPE